MQEREKLTKVTVQATIQTMTQRISGAIHILEWQRVKDYLDNLPEKFIAVTNAKVYNFKGEVIAEYDFLAINVENVIWVHPHDSHIETK